MLFSLLYTVLRVVLRLTPAGEAPDREAEILVLRHQVKVLQRQSTGRQLPHRASPVASRAGRVILPKGMVGAKVGAS